MASDSFHKDLERGLTIEQLVLSNLRKNFKYATLINAYKGYDIWIPEISCGVEVKYDEMSNKTGNLLIEFEFNGVPSALTTTLADWWVFYDGNEFAWIKPAEIIYYIFSHGLVYTTGISHGDRHSKKYFLVNKQELYKLAKIQESL